MTNIKKLRQDFHLSQEYIANYLGVEKSVYIDIETGYIDCSLDFLEKLAILFGVTNDELVKINYTCITDDEIINNLINFYKYKKE